MAYYDESVERCLKELDATEKGLSSKETVKRLAEHGPNQLAERPGTPWYVLLLQQFNSPVVWLLLAAGIIAFFLETVVDAIVIGVIVVLNALLGYLQERKAENAIAALKKTLAPHATVLRDGQPTTIDARDVVPGDILILETGSHVVADARIIWSASLQTQEAPLTGESNPVTKHADPVERSTPLAERTNMVYSGTMTTMGRGRALVTATGMKTEIGTITHLLQETQDEPTPLQRKIVTLGTTITIGVVVLALAIFTLGILEGERIATMFFTAVALAVAAIPEGLPAVITLALALGVQRMARARALVRRLPSVETLGACTVICTDKTGTLTHDQMTVRKLYVPHKSVDVSGGGYAPEGAVDGKGKDIELLLRIGALCNNATLRNEGGVWSVHGDPTEGALLVSAAKGKLDAHALQQHEPRIAELQFTSERKRMTTVHGTKRRVAYVKGAVDVILGRCSKKSVDGKTSALSAADRKRILDANDAMARQALRVLAFAYRPLGERDHVGEHLEKELVFVGLQGMIDPPREEVKDAIRIAHDAGIRVIMITGDHPVTAQAIATELGITGKAMTGTELSLLRDINGIVQETNVFARVDPAHKLDIISALRKQGHVVAMTGDGVNDAPALKSADIGIAMGRSGTDVAREASDMVLADDNFATIVAAVREGRAIYDNIIKFVSYLLRANLGEVLTIVGAIALRLPLPVSATMLLWVNLATDGLPALALSVEKPEPGVMGRLPREPKRPLLGRGQLVRIGVLALAMAAGVLFLFWRALPQGDAYAKTVAFCALVVAEMALVFGQRSEDAPLWRLGFLSNPWLLGAVSLSLLAQLAIVYVPFLQTLFGTVALSNGTWGGILIAGAVLFVLTQLLVLTTPTRK